MNAVISKLSADIRRRKLQTAVIIFVALLSSGAATLALSLVVESNAPYDQAFQRARGPHLVLTFDARRVTQSRLRQTASSPVTASAGPWPEVETKMVAAAGEASFVPPFRATVVGRSNPSPAVDKITIESGSWPSQTSQIVLSQSTADQLGLRLGDAVRFPDAPHHPTFQVSGIVDSISPVTDAWILPRSARALAVPRSPLEYQMAYRVSSAGSTSEVRTAEQAIAGRLPRGAVISTSDYLTVEQAAEIITAVMIPFLLSFSVFALAAATLIVANVVSGVVLANYREIGVMKSVGFTPAQVTWEILGQVLLPALAGSVAGVVVGTLASEPFLANTAHALGLPAASTEIGPVDFTVLSLVVGICLVASLIPAVRAGRLTAVGAITMGSAPGTRRGLTISRILSQWLLPRSLSLGLQEAVVRPMRSLMTIGSIVVGVATLVFALSLHLSLGQVYSHLERSSYAQLEFGFPTFPPGAKLKTGLALAPPPSERHVVGAFRANADVSRFVGEGQSNILASGIAEPIQYDGYDRPSSWLGYALISGRWFRHPGEVVAPTRMLTEAHLHVGGVVVVRSGSRTQHLHIVGEILDQTSNDLLLRGPFATLQALDPHARVTDYELRVRDGADATTVAQHLAQTLAPRGPNAFNIAIRGTGTDSSFILLNGVIAGLAIILTSIALAGVFNTVVLATRESGRDVAVLKALGMAPVQVVAMVVSSVAALGIIAGPVGIPGGLYLHRQVIQLMGQAASGTHIPPSFFYLISSPALALLALTGVLIAALGAWVPAQWAASKGTAEVLQTE